MENYIGMIALHGDLFEADRTNNCLVDPKTGEVVADLSQLKTDGNLVYGLYDPATKVFYTPDTLQAKQTGRTAKSFALPIKMISHSDTLSEREIVAYNRVSVLNDYGFQFIDAEYSARINNNRSIIGVHGIKYFVPEKTNYVGMFALHGDLYEIDRDKGLMVEYGNPVNIQSLEFLLYGFGSVAGLYDTETKSFYSSKDIFADAAEKDALRKFFIPQALIYDPETLNDARIQQYNLDSLNKKKGFYYIDEPLSDRLNGKLNEMEIDGVKYVIDLAALEIRQVENPEIKFVFDRIALFEPQQVYYNTLTKQPVEIDRRVSTFPEHVVCLKFPRLLELDIIGYTEMTGLAPTALVCDIPWKADAKKIQRIELVDTKIAEQVRRNQIEKEVQGTAPEKKASLTDEGVKKKTNQKKKR